MMSHLGTAFYISAEGLIVPVVVVVVVVATAAVAVVVVASCFLPLLSDF